MTSKVKTSGEGIQEFWKVLALQEKNLKYLQSAGLAADLVGPYKAILHYLRTRTDEQILAILRQTREKKSREYEPVQSEISDDVLERLTLDEVLEHISAKSASRHLLERIASVRFGVTKGAMSALKSRNALINKLLTLVRNEGTHTSIERAVDSSKDKVP